MHRDHEKDIEDVTKVLAPLVKRLSEIRLERQYSPREMQDIYHLHVQLDPRMFFGIRDIKEKEYIAHYLAQNVKHQVMTLTFVEPRRGY